MRFANPSFCKMFDYVSTEVIGRNAAELFSTKKVRKSAHVTAIIDISTNVTEEFIVENKQGKTLVVEVSTSNVTSVSGEMVGRMASFVDITKRKEIETNREKLLQDTVDKIKILRGIISICASYQKIRDDKGYRNQLENYIREHSEADFSHALCGDCAKELYP